MTNYRAIKWNSKIEWNNINESMPEKNTLTVFVGKLDDDEKITIFNWKPLYELEVEINAINSEDKS